MIYWTLFLGIALISALVFGPMGSQIAEDRQRSPVEGLMLGLIFGPFGAIAETFLPKGSMRPIPSQTHLPEAWEQADGSR